MSRTVTIAGKKLPMRPLERKELKGVFTDALLMFAFYNIEYMGMQLVLLESKVTNKFTPAQSRKLTTNLSAVLEKPCVMMFNQLAAYERNRYIEQGVYFVVSGKYVYLPFLIVNAKDSRPINKERMQPAAQYLLLYHLQIQRLEGCTLTDIEGLIPYNYQTISRAVRQLEAMKLIYVKIAEGRMKSIFFTKEGYSLWEEAAPLMQNPIKSVWYTDTETAHGTEGGINALSHYSSINPERMQTKVLSDSEFKKATKNRKLPELNTMDGTTRIEVWKYPPVIQHEDNYVDKLSLALSLKEDNDPRVEKEVELMINGIW